MVKQKVPKEAFFIRLDSKNPEVFEYEPEDLKEDMKFFKISDPEKMSDYDFKVFNNLKAAEAYLKRFKKALKALPKLKSGGWKAGPSLIYKRHYLAQSYMGEKMQTYRSYSKPWKRGDVIKLYDQTYFLLVQLKGITKTRHGYKFAFKKVRK